MSKCEHHMDGQIFLDPDMQIELDQCVMKQTHIYRNVTVEILECPICGKREIGWYRQDNTEEIDDISDE